MKFCRGRWANVVPLRGKKIEFGVVKKKLFCPNGFFNLWVGRVVNFTLASKFGSPAQRWDRVGLGKGGTVESWAPTYSPLGKFFFF
jgi:hypothetical protein